MGAGLRVARGHDLVGAAADIPPDVLALAGQTFADCGEGARWIVDRCAKAIMTDRRNRQRRAGGLTSRQYETLAFIRSYIASRGCSPSFDEIAAHLDLKSKSGVSRLVTALERRGAIRRSSSRGARDIVVVRES